MVGSRFHRAAWLEENTSDHFLLFYLADSYADIHTHSHKNYPVQKCHHNESYFLLPKPLSGLAAYFQCQSMFALAADGTKQLAGVCKREYLFTNNPLITSDGQRDQTLGATQELALNESELEIWVLY